uniref:ABC transporter domain-containing protein n=1 Tax=Heterorhabditis bacteriophora TaxID=37862 RepID=A0A1I7WWL7_HETBA
MPHYRLIYWNAEMCRSYNRIFSPPIVAQFLKEVSLEAYSGQIHAIMGVSGYRFNQLCSYVTFGVKYPGFLSVRNLLYYTARLSLGRSVSLTETNQRVLSVMKDFEILGYGHKRLDALSESARRRTMVAIALIKDPSLYIIVFKVSIATVDRETTARYVETQDQAVRLVEYFKNYSSSSLCEDNSKSDVYANARSTALCHLEKKLMTQKFYILMSVNLLSGSWSIPHSASGIFQITNTIFYMMATFLTHLAYSPLRTLSFHESFEGLYGQMWSALGYLTVVTVVDILSIFISTALIMWLSNLTLSLVILRTSFLLLATFFHAQFITMTCMMYISDSLNCTGLAITIMFLWILLGGGLARLYKYPYGHYQLSIYFNLQFVSDPKQVVSNISPTSEQHKEESEPETTLKATDSSQSHSKGRSCNNRKCLLCRDMSFYVYEISDGNFMTDLLGVAKEIGEAIGEKSHEGVQAVEQGASRAADKTQDAAHGLAQMTQEDIQKISQGIGLLVGKIKDAVSVENTTDKVEDPENMDTIKWYLPIEVTKLDSKDGKVQLTTVHDTTESGININKEVNSEETTHVMRIIFVGNEFLSSLIDVAKGVGKAIGEKSQEGAQALGHGASAAAHHTRETTQGMAQMAQSDIDKISQGIDSLVDTLKEKAAKTFGQKTSECVDENIDGNTSIKKSENVELRTESDSTSVPVVDDIEGGISKIHCGGYTASNCEADKKLEESSSMSSTDYQNPNNEWPEKCCNLKQNPQLKTEDTKVSQQH